MRISLDRKKDKLWLSQHNYIENELDRFNTGISKPLGAPLASHFKLNYEQCLTSEEDKKAMKNVPYASTFGSLMYVMVCRRPYIAYVVGVISQFFFNLGKGH